MMRIVIRIIGVWLIFLTVFLPAHAPAQTGPLLPPPPLGYPLDWWRFDDTNWLTVSGYAPTSFTNLTLISDWDTNALQVDSTNAAWLQYPVVEPDGHTNLPIIYGSARFWFLPNWISTNQGGAGPGVWARLIDVGAYTTNASYGWWSLYLNPSGDDLFFSAQTNSGVTTNYCFVPISWDNATWHQIALTYSSTDIAIYLDGVLATNGPGLSVWPGPEVLSNGFFIGSDGNGIAQAHGQFDDLWTFDYPLDSNDIAANFAYFASLANPGFGPDDGGLLPPGDSGGGGGGGDDGGSGFTEPTYTSNELWLAIFPPGTNSYATNTNSGTMTVVLNNTIADIAYELFSATNLTATNISWASEQTVIGSELTNYTVAIIPMKGRTNLFLKALAATLDSDGDGLPDWWETLYSTTNFPLSPTNADTGSTGVPDGYKQDSAGDGYDNLQKYQMGIAPNVWVTPPSPQGFSAVLNSNETSALLSWVASPGPVTNYTILVQDDQLDGEFVVLTNLAATQTNFTDSSSIFSDGIQYEIQADYAGGASAVTGQNDPTIQPAYTTETAIVRGPQGGLYLLASAIPQNVVGIRVYWGAGIAPYPLFNYGLISDESFTPTINNTAYYYVDPADYFDVPVSNFSNGVYQIPTNQCSLFGSYIFATQAIGADGRVGNVSGSFPSSILSGYAEYTWSALNIPFIDGRTNIEQNVDYQLRGAMVGEPFTFSISPFDEYPGDYAEAGGSNYVVSGFHYDAGDGAELDEFHPFEESSLYAYLNYAPGGFNSLGHFTNGVIPDVPYVCLSNVSTMFQVYNYVVSSNYEPITPVLGAPTNPIVSFWDSEHDLFPLDGCASNVGGGYTLQIGAKNLYGLAFQSVTYFNSIGSFDTVGPGESFNNDGSGWWFHNVTSPALNTVGYYFARPGIDPLPGETGFSTTNATPTPLFAAVGQPFTITGWAKQAVTNGYSDVYAYPEQYFDKAYFADTNGNPTTNQTGILSEYGEFFPTDPGQIILTTKPDGATGSTGQCTVNVIKMALDVNHDGTMDLSYGGPDNTSADRPFKFWINDDCDDANISTNLGADLNEPTVHDYASGIINSLRDLEDYARLWICGMPALTNGSYQVTLTWTNVVSGSPSIELFNAVESNGGYGYLTNTTIAAEQAATINTGSLFLPVYSSGQGVSIGIVTNGSTFTFPSNYFTNDTTKHLLFEGAGVGQGELLLTVSNNGTNVASTSVFMNLMDVSTMFEHAHAVNVPDYSPPSALVSRMVLDNTLPADPTEAKQMIVFVHGINNTPWAYENTSETMFKRLYWSGYLGRFASFRWPCGYFPPSSGVYPYEFNESEFWAYKSGTAFKEYFTYLRGATNRLPGYTLNVIAHSQGAAVVTEALSEGAPFDNYILTQGAVPAHCFDTNAPEYEPLVDADAAVPTPYAASVGGYNGCWTNVSGNIVNFINTNDFALVSGSYGPLHANWIANQASQKPESYSDGSFYGFNTNTQVSTYYQSGSGSYTVSDLQECRAMVARSRTMPVGGQGGLGGIINSNATVDLIANYGFGKTRPDHSAEFTRPIQIVWPYYDQMLRSFQIQLNVTR
jgi:Concanavalin A-like lectin/glucanases superfamily/Alpha/beta hydrolase of unknown function (DUF900)